MLRTIAEYIVPLGADPDTTSSVELDDTRGNPHYYERQDLRAQESVARATNALVRLTCITIFLGVMGTVLLIWTLRANTRAAEAATEANRIARLDMRAWVTVRWEVPCEVKLSQDGKICDIKWRYNFKNLGKSPAFRTRYEWSIYRLDTQYAGVGNIGVDGVITSAMARIRNPSSTPILFPSEKTKHGRVTGQVTIEGHEVGSLFLCGCVAYALDYHGKEFAFEARAYEIEETSDLAEGFTHRLLRIPQYDKIGTWVVNRAVQVLVETPSIRIKTLLV